MNGAAGPGLVFAYQDEHVYLRHRPGECHSGCPICEGGLLYCVRCGQAEGELMPTCAGNPGITDQERAVREADQRRR